MKKPVNFSIQFPATRSTISEKIRGAGASHEFWRPCKVFRRQDDQQAALPLSAQPGSPPLLVRHHLGHPDHKLALRRSFSLSFV